jgi:tetratricopeptide (TPR) repeat protein
MAHEAYLRGRFCWGQRTEDALTKAISHFEQALSIDSNCAHAYSGIADCCSLLCWFGAMAPLESGPKAAAAAERALELDDSLSEGHASLALVRFWYEWDWKGAEEEFLRAIELNPSYAVAHQWYASYLNAMGRLEEAQAELSRARQLDPLSLIISMNAADTLFYGRKFDQAIEHLRALLEQEPRFLPALFNLGRVYVQKGMYDEAVSAFEQAQRYSGNPQAYPALAHAYALAGKTNEARKILRQLTEQSDSRFPASPLIARIHLGLGETEQAIEWLRKGVEERSYWMTMLHGDPVYDGIRSDPRFRDLLKRIGFQSERPTERAKTRGA